MNQEPERKEMTLRLTWPEYDAINAARKQFSPHVRENFHSCVRRLLAEALEAHDAGIKIHPYNPAIRGE